MVKKIILAFIAWLIFRLGLFPMLLYFGSRWFIKRKSKWGLAFPFVERRKHHHYQILVYHHVNDERVPFVRSVPVKVFAKQMKILHRYFNVLPLEELVERVALKDVPPNAVAITFDDGYQDNYGNAFPILKQFSLPATIFLATGVLDNKTVLWHDQVFDLFRRIITKSITIDGKEYPFSKVSEKRIALNTFLRNIRLCNPQERDKRIRQLAIDMQVKETKRIRKRMLSWQEIREMSRYNISFGAHTVTHPILTRIPNAAVEYEIITSRESIEKQLQIPIRLFAYPNGSCDDFSGTVKEILKKAGFLCAVTTLWGNNFCYTDPFELQRVGWGWDSDPLIFALKLAWYKFSL